MKIVYIYRKRASGNSIEELFHSIAPYVGGFYETHEYQLRGFRYLLDDILQLRRMKADVYHITGDVNYIGCFLPHNKFVLTIHDIGHLLFGLSGLKAKIYKLVWFILPLYCAKAITTISEETKSNISRVFPFVCNKITVIPNCCSPMFKPVSHEFRSAKPVILQVGTKSYKNVPRLIKALDGVPCKLVLIGPLSDEIQGLLQQHHIDFENHVGISHQEVYEQYVNCDIVTFISIGEGFGVPILEAQAVGRPIVTSNVSPLSDVAGVGACLVDPLKIEHIKEQILMIIHDENYHKQLIANGFQNIKLYSLGSVCQQYINIYNRIKNYDY